VRIEACLNGARKPGEHPALPITPTELADDARRTAAAGARLLHVHPRGPDGLETLDALACDAAARAIRNACPGIPVGFSTGAWITGDHLLRMELIGSWVDRPDFASVNFSESGAIDLSELLLRIGIGIEAGISTVADAELFLDSGYARHAQRVLVEPEEESDPVKAEATAALISAALDHAGNDLPRVFHGFGMATWRVIELGLDGGWDVRAGLEDTLQLPDGTTASGNAVLVAAAARMAREKGVLRA
jgi:uncharacterized protein (DUF849 family)